MQFFVDVWNSWGLLNACSCVSSCLLEELLGFSTIGFFPALPWRQVSGVYPNGNQSSWIPFSHTHFSNWAANLDQLLTGTTGGRFRQASSHWLSLSDCIFGFRWAILHNSLDHGGTQAITPHQGVVSLLQKKTNSSNICHLFTLIFHAFALSSFSGAHNPLYSFFPVPENKCCVPRIRIVYPWFW